MHNVQGTVRRSQREVGQACKRAADDIMVGGSI